MLGYIAEDYEIELEDEIHKGHYGDYLMEKYYLDHPEDLPEDDEDYEDEEEEDDD